MVAVKGQRMNPRSLANLKPFTKDTRPNPTGERGPLVTPAMRKYAGWSLKRLEELWEDPPGSMTVAEGIAITTLIDALKTGAFTTGAKSRELVMNRLDGEAAKANVEVNVGVSVNLSWDDGSKA